QGAKIGADLDASGSTFEGTFEGRNLSVRTNLFLSDTKLGEVNLDTAEIGADLDARGSTFEETFEAVNASVQGNLFLSEKATFKTVDLNAAEIGADLNASGSTFEETFKAVDASVQGNLFLSNKATFKTVGLIGAKIGGDLFANGSIFEGTFTAPDISVQGSLLLRDSATFKEVDLSGAKIGQNLDMHGSTFSGKINLASAEVGDVFVLSEANDVPSWTDDSRLVLRNLSVSALQDHEDAWKGLERRLDLIGFVYQRIGGADVEADQEMADLEADRETASPVRSQEIASRSTDWLAAWLNKQENSESVHFPQPYQQLADTLRAQGFSDKADAIMIAANDHRYSLPTIDMGTKALLWIEWATIGYGYERFPLPCLAGCVCPPWNDRRQFRQRRLGAFCAFTTILV
ncbi:MAG: hypothetical protein ACR2RE_09910, partial [Geminicoccaceae bacterium]